MAAYFHLADCQCHAPNGCAAFTWSKASRRTIPRNPDFRPDQISGGRQDESITRAKIRMKTRVDSLLFFSERWLFVLHLFNHDYNIRATYVVNIFLVNATPVILL